MGIAALTQRVNLIERRVNLIERRVSLIEPEGQFDRGGGSIRFSQQVGLIDPQGQSVYSYRIMKLRDGEIVRIAASILARLEKANLLRITSNRAALEQRIVAAIRSNMRAEEEIEVEANRFADAHAREMVGMDRHKVLQLVKERIAKEKGFTL